jgi:hypothetical protein
MPLDTRTVTGRRALHLASLDDLSAEVERLAEAAAAGHVRALGNWSPAQALWHIGRLIGFSLDGFPFRYPWWLRWPARLLRLMSWRWLVRLAFRPGFTNPPAARAVEPDPAVPLPEAVAFLSGQLDRLRRGERMTYPSPVEGPITHEQWLFAHLRHAELHLSFLIPQEG